MKFFIDNKLIFELNETKQKVIKDNVFSESFVFNMGNRVKWVILKKYEDSLNGLKKEWIEKLKLSGVDSIPLDNDKFAELVFSQKEYKSRSERDKPLPDNIK